jgi:RNA polymerase sigma factor (TIGR02999 family)
VGEYDMKEDAIDSADAQSLEQRGIEEAFPLVYAELQVLARRYLQLERPDNTLSPASLVHEAYLRLANLDRIRWRGKTHVMAVAATQMRRILVEYARAMARQKRGGRPIRVTLDEQIAPVAGVPLDLIALDEALDRLARRRRRQAHVAVLRIFSGMTLREVADAVGVSEDTVKQDWKIGRAWLKRWLRPRKSRS